MRLFVSIELSPEVLAQIAALQAQLAKTAPLHSVRWTPPEQLHLTMQFLGDIAVEKVGALRDALSAACANCSELKLRAENVGSFPSARNPHVLWIGVSGDAARLSALQNRIASACEPFVERRELAEIARILQTSKAPAFDSWRVTNVKLMRSTLGSAGATHEFLAEFSL